MLKKVCFLSILFFTLAGCSTKPVETKPEPQKMQVEKVDKAVQKGNVSLYACKDDKQVRVVHSTQRKSKKTLHRVTITFNNVTERLTLVISERGKNYSNIRWLWQERSDFSMLKTTVGEVLAEQCILRQNELLAEQ